MGDWFVVYCHCASLSFVVICAFMVIYSPRRREEREDSFANLLICSSAHFPIFLRASDFELFCPAHTTCCGSAALAARSSRQAKRIVSHRRPRIYFSAGVRAALLSTVTNLDARKDVLNYHYLRYWLYCVLCVRALYKYLSIR